ncbi:MAG: hypothetical protein AAGD35_06155 [Actinomycetota bacterium]
MANDVGLDRMSWQLDTYEIWWEAWHLVQGHYAPLDELRRFGTEARTAVAERVSILRSHPEVDPSLPDEPTEEDLTISAEIEVLLEIIAAAAGLTMRELRSEG